MPKKKSLVSQVADAVQLLNAEGGERSVALPSGKFLTIDAAEDCDLPYWSENMTAKEAREVYEPKDLEGLSVFQMRNGGAAGLYFALTDKDGEDLGEEGGQYDGYLTQWSAPMPRNLALQCARDLLDAVGIKVS
jgi:hypothetical protein